MSFKFEYDKIIIDYWYVINNVQSIQKSKGKVYKIDEEWAGIYESMKKPPIYVSINAGVLLEYTNYLVWPFYIP